MTRKLPSTLVITVEERKALLAFKYDDDYLLLDEEGILLKKTRTEPKLTLVQGNIVSKIKLGERIGTENEDLLEDSLRLMRRMQSGDLYFVRVDMKHREDIRAYIYDTFVVRSEYETLMTAIKNGRLHKVIERLFAEGVRRGTIKLEDDGSASFQPGI